MELCSRYPEVQRLRWKQSVLEAYRPLIAEDYEPDEFASYVRELNLVPDAYAMHTHLRELVFFEVEVYSPLSASKLKQYAKFMIDLAGFEIGFAVMVINRHGHINELDLMPHYASWLSEVAA